MGTHPSLTTVQAGILRKGSQQVRRVSGVAGKAILNVTIQAQRQRRGFGHR